MCAHFKGAYPWTQPQSSTEMKCTVWSVIFPQKMVLVTWMPVPPFWMADSQSKWQWNAVYSYTFFLGSYIRTVNSVLVVKYSKNCRICSANCSLMPLLALQFWNLVHKAFMFLGTVWAKLYDMEHLCWKTISEVISTVPVNFCIYE
jgi:hypothetical protein